MARLQGGWQRPGGDPYPMYTVQVSIPYVCGLIPMYVVNLVQYDYLYICKESGGSHSGWEGAAQGNVFEQSLMMGIPRHLDSFQVCASCLLLLHLFKTQLPHCLLLPPFSFSLMSTTRTLFT